MVANGSIKCNVRQLIKLIAFISKEKEVDEIKEESEEEEEEGMMETDFDSTLKGTVSP